MRINKNELDFDAENTSTILTSDPHDLSFADGFSVSAKWVNSNPSAKTFDSGVAEVTNITVPAENGVKEVTTVQCPAASAITTGHYFTLNSALDATAYYVWFNKDSGGGDPAPASKTAIPVAIVGADTATQVATKLASAINAVSASFSCPAPGSDTATVTNAKTGSTTNAADVNAGVTVVVTTQGVTSVLNGKYFTINSADDAIAYYVWFSTAGTEGTDPAISGKTGVKVSTAIGDSANTVADKLAAALDALAAFVAPNPAAAVVGCTNASYGVTTNAANVNVGTGFSIAVATQGVDSEIDIPNDKVSIPSHGYLVGLKGQLTTTGTLPAGLSTTTDYWIIPVDSNHVSFATTRANAIAGTAIDLTDEGTGVHTFTSTSGSAGTIKLQACNDLDTDDWKDITNSSVTINGNSNDLWPIGPVWYKYARVYIDITTGQLTFTSRFVTKGSETL
jgi:hypothetical protein